MAIDIKFTANMEQVRRAFDALKQDAARGIPVGTGAGASGLGFSAAPTIANVLGQKTVITNPAWVAAIAAAQTGGDGTGGGAGGVGGVGGTAAGAPGFLAGYSTRGFNRLVGAGYAFNMGFRAAEVEREYAINSVLAGNDQRRQYDAMMKAREGIIGAFGPVGRAAGFLQDQTGMVEAEARATLNYADVQDAKTASMKSGSDLTANLRGEANISGIRNPYQRDVAAFEEAHRKKLQMIEEEGKARQKVSEKSLEAYRASLDASRRRRAGLEDLEDSFGPTLGFHRRETVDAANAKYAQLEIEDANSVSQQRHNLAVQDRNRTNLNRNLANTAYQNDLDEMMRDERLRVGMARERALGDAAVSGLEGAGNVRAAHRLAILNQNQNALGKAIADREDPSVIAALNLAGQARLDAFDAITGRAERLDLAGLDSQYAVQRAIAGRDPLAARLAQISARRDRELGGLAADDPRRAGINRNALAESFLSAREAYEHRRYSQEDEDRRSGILNALVEHHPLEARLRAISARAEQQLRDPDADRLAVEGERFREERLARQEDAERRGLLREALAGEGKSLNLILHDSPNAARANDIATRAGLEARRLRYEGDDENANQVLRNAVLQEQVLKKAYLESFKPVEVDPTYTAINGPRGGQEDSVAVMREIKTAIDGLRSDLTGGVAVGP